MLNKVLEKFVVAVPQNYAYVVEHLGKYHQTLSPGLNFLIPFVQQVRFKLSLKEQSFLIYTQNLVTKDNVIMQMDGVLYLRIIDPFKCSYGSKDPINYTCILAQSCMRSEIGKLTLDQTFEERDKINDKILQSLKQSTEEWGLYCLRYEIKDIRVSETIKQVMNLEADSERKKRAEILMSEGRKTSEINLAEAQKRSSILKAEGKAKQILLNAEAISARIKVITEALNQNESGLEAANYQIASQFVDAYSSLIDPKKNIVIKADLNDPNSITNESLQLLQNTQIKK